MPDGSQFVVSSLDQQIIFYDRNGGFLRQWTTLNLQVSDFAITPDGTRIVAATTAVQRVRVGDKLKPSISVRDDSGSNQAFERMPHGVHIIRISDNEILHYISDINASDVTSVRLSHDGQRVLLSCAPDELQMFSIEPHLHFMRKFVGHVQSRFIIRSAFGAPKDRFVLSGSEDGHVYVWQNSAATPLEVLSGHRDTVNAVAWNPVLSRKLFASCSDDTEM
jgi:WD40 repeat protein